MNPSIEIAGLTLVHFVWQGTLVGAAAAAALWALRTAAPHVRYAVACAALAAMLAAPAATALMLAGAGRAGSAPAGARAAISEPFASTGSAAPGHATGGEAEAHVLLAPAAPPVSERAAPIDAWLPRIVLLWLAGVAVLLARTTGGWLRVRRLQRTSSHAAPSRWEDACSRVAALLRVSRAVRVVDSALVDTPMVIGWVRPVILLPVAALANLSPAQVDAILAHELAHIRRHDFLVNLVQAAAETLLFYHPAVWWISARIRAEREHCCDAVAVGVSGDPVGYAEALTELESWRTASSTLAMAVTGGSLLDRVRHLLAVPPEHTRRSPGIAAVLGLAAIVVTSVGAGQYLQAQRGSGQEAAPSQAASARSAADAVAWRMVFNHASSELNIIGYTGRDLIRYAYQIPKARVIGGPAWIDDETFRIVVNLDAPPAADDVPSIIRRVLEERFELVTHVEQRDLPAYALVMARADRAPGPNLRVSTRDCFDLQAWIAAGQPPRAPRPDAQRQPICGEETWDSTVSRTSYVAITMPQLAADMRGISRLKLAGARGDWPDTGRDVIDRTGLSGRYDVDLHAFLPATALMGRYPIFKMLFEPLGLPSMETALEQQLGLRLEDTTRPSDVIVIDSARRPAT